MPLLSLNDLWPLELDFFYLPEADRGCGATSISTLPVQLLGEAGSTLKNSANGILQMSSAA
jgi:hypothetical protein